MIAAFPFTTGDVLEEIQSQASKTCQLLGTCILVPIESREKCDWSHPKIKNTHQLQRDSEHWTDADWFQTERFLGSSIDFKGTDSDFVSFWAGERVRPNISFGLCSC